MASVQIVPVAPVNSIDNRDAFCVCTGSTSGYSGQY